jgi:FkbM family methyltransferase
MGTSPSDSDDQPFHHYTAKHRIVAWISQNLFDNATYTVRHGLIKGMKRHGGLAWIPEFAVGKATPEHTFWMNLDLAGDVVYDIGAFHGLLSLFFAKKARQVISYEPNTRNHARLISNLQLNNVKNVHVRKVGLGSKTESATMVVSPIMPGGASVESETVTGLLKLTDAVSENISIVTLDDDMREMSLPKPDFIKVDVEGQELEVLLGARNCLVTYKPRLFLEMHGETMNLKRKKVAAIVEYLLGIGYSDILHIESGSQIGVGNSAVAAEGHLLCRP